MPIIVTAMVLRDAGGRVLLAQRKTPPSLEGMWEFPGGKLDPGESPEECLAREIMEELGMRIGVRDIFDVCYHVYPDKEILMLCYDCILLGGEPSGLEGQIFGWFDPDDLSGLPIVPADKRPLRKLALLANPSATPAIESKS